MSALRLLTKASGSFYSNAGTLNLSREAAGRALLNVQTYAVGGGNGFAAP